MAKIKKFGDLYFKATGEAFKKFGFVNHEIITKWSYVIGQELATICSPEMIKFPPFKTRDGVLIVNVTNPGFCLAIQAQESRIIERISTFFGYQAVNKIKVRIIPVQNNKPEIIIKKAMIVLEQEVFNKINNLPDKELANAMLELASSMAA